jgi:hypothetical protein
LIQPAISSRVRKQPAQWPDASSAQMLMQGDIGRLDIEFSVITVSDPSFRSQAADSLPA